MAELTHMEWMVAGIANAEAEGLTKFEVLALAIEATSAEDFDSRINAFTTFTREPEEGQTVIELPV